MKTELRKELVEVNSLVKAIETEWVKVRGDLTKQETEDKINSCVSGETYTLRDQEEKLRITRNNLWDKQRKIIGKLSIIKALELHGHECPYISELYQKYVIEQVAVESLSQDLRDTFQDYVNIYSSEFI